MKSPLSSYLSTFLLGAMLLLIGILIPAASQAQGRHSQGSQAQSGFEEPMQKDGQQVDAKQVHGEQIPASGEEAVNGWSRIDHEKTSALDRMLEAKLRPTKPNRPIPMVLIVLGTLFVILWAASIVGLVLAIGTALAVLMLILAILFLPLLILGVIFLIGGIIASTSGRHKAQ